VMLACRGRERGRASISSADRHAIGGRGRFARRGIGEDCCETVVRFSILRPCLKSSAGVQLACGSGGSGMNSVRGVSASDLRSRHGCLIALFRARQIPVTWRRLGKVVRRPASGERRRPGGNLRARLENHELEFAKRPAGLPIYFTETNEHGASICRAGTCSRAPGLSTMSIYIRSEMDRHRERVRRLQPATMVSETRRPPAQAACLRHDGKPGCASSSALGRQPRSADRTSSHLGPEASQAYARSGRCRCPPSSSSRRRGVSSQPAHAVAMNHLAFEQVGQRVDKPMCG